jgi:hypothetical protein
VGAAEEVEVVVEAVEAVAAVPVMVANFNK